MNINLRKPDNSEVQDFVYAGENIFIAGPSVEHISAVIESLPDSVREKGEYVLGVALSPSRMTEQGSLGDPLVGRVPYNCGLMGLYVPPEFSQEVGESVTLKEAFDFSKGSLDDYVKAAEFVIRGCK